MNWFIKPLKRKRQISLEQTSWTRFKKNVLPWLIIYEKEDILPDIDGDPPTTSSEATIGEGSENNYPLKKKDHTPSFKKLEIDDIKDETL